MLASVNKTIGSLILRNSNTGQLFISSGKMVAPPLLHLVKAGMEYFGHYEPVTTLKEKYLGLFYYYNMSQVFPISMV